MPEDEVPHPPIVDEAEWRAQRLALLAKEKALTKHYDEVGAERRRLPMVKVEKAYTFDTPEGKRTLRDLFGDCRQLAVYHFMFAPEDKAPCMGCTSWVDALGDLSLLGERDTAFTLISRAPLPRLEATKAEKGWTAPWASSFENDFNYDFHVTLDESRTPVEYNYKDKEALLARGGPDSIKGEGHGFSVFFRLGEDVYHTYSTFARGAENLTHTYAMLDVTPYGRQEDFEDSPAGFPQKPTYG